MRFDGARVLLTGASAGIGMEMARVLAPRAKCLALVARRRERLDALKAELQKSHPSLEVEVYACDLGSRPALEALCNGIAERWGAPDVIINNAGFGYVSLYEFAEWPRVEQMFELNMTSLAYVCHKFLPTMIERRSGGILNVSSGLGMTFTPMMAAYTGTKHFVTGFTEALHMEAKPYGVVVSQLCPGPVKTEFEEVAGNPIGFKVPAILQITGRQCAEQALRAFEKGRALITPGFVYRNFFRFLVQAWPRFMLRFVQGLAVPGMRKKQVESMAAAKAANPSRGAVVPEANPKESVSP